jgi:diguanylate cyclase (GGDEF)-like protein
VSLARSAWGFAAAGAVALIAIHRLLPEASLEQSLLYDAIGGLAVFGILVGVVLNRPSRRAPWVLIALGQALFVIGDVLWVYYEQIGESPFPSMADAFYLGGYPFMAAGLALLIRRRLGGGDRAGLIDAAILTTAAGMLTWVYIMVPALLGAELTPLELAISAAYPLADILLIGVATGLMTTPGARTPAFGMVVASLLILLVADQIYQFQTLEGTYVAGGPIDTLYLVSYAAIAIGALHPSMRALTEPHPVPVTWLGPVRLLFLAAAMVTGPVLVVALDTTVDPQLVVIGACTAILSLLVLVRLAGLVGVLERDVAQRRVLEERLSHQANTDPLTGLANRRLFLREVASALEPRLDGDRGMALLFLDLDAFKKVNDELGHAVGDAILHAVADRIRECLRGVDLAARLGGDEFGVLLREIGDEDQSDAVADRILAALAEPLTIGGDKVIPAASIGIATCTPGHLTADELLNLADSAMYRAKSLPARRYRVAARTRPVVDVEPDARIPALPGEGTMTAGLEGA